MHVLTNISSLQFYLRHTRWNPSSSPYFNFFCFTLLPTPHTPDPPPALRTAPRLSWGVLESCMRGGEMKQGKKRKQGGVVENGLQWSRVSSRVFLGPLFGRFTWESGPWQPIHLLLCQKRGSGASWEGGGLQEGVRSWKVQRIKIKMEMAVK